MMNNKKELEVILLYRSNEGNEMTFNDIVNSVDTMDENHYEPVGFWNCSGGLSICVNEYQLIFHSCNFYNLIKVTNFLMQSFCLIKGKTLNRFDAIDFYSEGLVLNTLRNEALILKGIDDEQISLSFKSSIPNHQRRRGERYFENIVFEKKRWVEEGQIAFKEFFDVLLRIVDINEGEDQYKKMMVEYYKDWQSI